MDTKLHEYSSVFESVISLAKGIQQTEIIKISLANNLINRVVAHNVLSPINQPPFNMSAMDGYGVSTLATAIYLPIVETGFAGKTTKNTPNKIANNKAVQLMTGAIVPSGINCVIPQEDIKLTAIEDGQQSIKKPAGLSLYKNIKQIGSDLVKGQCLVKEGHVIRAQDIALLASVGVTEIAVYKTVKLAILVVGDELVAIGNELSTGNIYESNSWLIAGLVAGLAVELIEVSVLTDNYQEIKQKVIELDARVDIIITIGGASVGKKDFIKKLVSQLSNSLSWQINMQPAKHFSMVTLANSWLLALPGNPLATFMSFQLFVKPFISKVSGALKWQQEPQLLALEQAVEPNKSKLQWLQAQKTPLGVMPFAKTSTSQLSRLINADGYIGIEAGKSYKKGDLVKFWEY